MVCPQRKKITRAKNSLQNSNFVFIPSLLGTRRVSTTMLSLNKNWERREQHSPSCFGPFSHSLSPDTLPGVGL